MHGGRGGVVTLGAFRERADELILHMNHFFIRYLRSLAVEFEGDLQRAILLGEIGRHNVARHYTSGNPPANRAGLSAEKTRSRGGRDVPPSGTRGTVAKRRLHGRSP